MCCGPCVDVALRDALASASRVVLATWMWVAHKSSCLAGAFGAPRSRVGNCRTGVPTQRAPKLTLHAPSAPSCMADDTAREWPERPDTPDDCIITIVRGSAQQQQLAAHGGGDAEGSPRSQEDSARLGPRCRICLDHVSASQFESGDGVRLDCRCRGDAGILHRECAERWFQRKQRLECEVCAAPVTNVRLLPPLPTPQRRRSAQPGAPRHGRRRRSSSSRRNAFSTGAPLVTDHALWPTRCLFAAGSAVAVAVCVYYLFVMKANILVSMALAALCSTVYCSLGAHDIIYSPRARAADNVLTMWLLFSAAAATGWAIAFAELINHVAFQDTQPLTACTAGACVSVAAVFLHFKSRALARLLLARCMSGSASAGQPQRPPAGPLQVVDIQLAPPPPPAAANV